MADQVRYETVASPQDYFTLGLATLFYLQDLCTRFASSRADGRGRAVVRLIGWIQLRVDGKLAGEAYVSSTRLVFKVS